MIEQKLRGITAKLNNKRKQNNSNYILQNYFAFLIVKDRFRQIFYSKYDIYKLEEVNE